MPAPMAREDPETVAIDYDSQRVLLVRPPSLTTLKDILRAHFGLACSNPAMILERDGLQYGDTEATPCSGKAYHRPMSLRVSAVFSAGAKQSPSWMAAHGDVAHGQIDPKRCKETSQTIVLWHGKSATIIDVSPSVKACKELALRHLGLTEPADQDIKLFWKSKTGEQMEVCSDRFMQGIEPMSHFVLKVNSRHRLTDRNEEFSPFLHVG